jgi:integrase
MLPDILSIGEVERLINGTRELRYQTFLLSAYSMGLRLGEALSLRISDIDSQRMKVHVHLGKGQKDRFVTLPKTTLAALRNYWSSHRNPLWIFPAGTTAKLRYAATGAMNRGGLQKSIQVIVKDCGIRKRVTIHSLRHCYGAHLVEAGLHLRAIQHEMGHDSPKTTALYTQLTDVAHQDSAILINALVNRLDLTLDGEV